MALGADAPRIRTLLFRQTVRMLAAGLLAGLPLAAGMSRLYASLLFDVQPGDPVTLGCAVAVLFAVAWLATFLPALGASRSNPLTVLRAE
jgi:putative ABC transport system permease protein